ncbi:MAG TPA: class I SAM-dependent methyltransferase, partial [Kofleriaceae bacterium]|nr:class I SAM-dependent methyltransferase [Kofleriaceae bacterium]
MSKRDEDSSDMEVGMTTAERRRRRRRGAGLRVPSDNVPRSRTPTGAPPAPVPEDPALAMSIAYSFTNDASGPVPRAHEMSNEMSAPVAPEAMATVIDPPSGPVDSDNFETTTREMSAVDLEALGLNADGTSNGSRHDRARTDPVTRVDKPVDVDVDVTLDEPVTAQRAAVADPIHKRTTAPMTAAQGNQNRLKTVALSDDDLEDLRPQTQPGAKKSRADVNKTIQLAAIDIEAMQKAAQGDEPVSVADIDIQELAERAEQSGEIEVDVDDDKPENQPTRQMAVPASAVTKPMRAQTEPPPAPPTARASVPPPMGEKKSGIIEAQHAPAAHGSAQHPPPMPAAAKDHHAPPPVPPKAPPPAPAKKPVSQAAVAAVVTKEPSKPTSRARPWFVDLFDEDYLRTLPFLTPQATQAEAEFVINGMNLAAGAQVLDLGCGYGRHAMELAARGFHVVGLDISTPLLVRGGEEAHRRGLTINFVRGDMRELDFENQFDATYCLFSTFGYFDDETNKKTLQNVARALKPGGKVLVEILNRDYVIADLPTRVWWEGDGCVVLEEVELNYFSSRIQVNRSVVFDDGRQLEQEISVRAYSLHEVGKLMHAAGFRVLEVSGGYQTRGRFFGNQSRHIIVLAERK